MPSIGGSLETKIVNNEVISQCYFGGDIELLQGA